MFHVDRCIKCVDVPQHSEPAVCESNFMVLDAYTCDREGNSYTITLDKVGSDVAACEAICIHTGESPCDRYDLVVLACDVMTICMLILDDRIVLASPRSWQRTSQHSVTRRRMSDDRNGWDLPGLVELHSLALYELHGWY